ncbi:MAG: hypothetical protein V1809_03340 [Planctomycetota bacterium]
MKAVVGPVKNRFHGTTIADLGYPLASELWSICFPGEQPREDGSIEARFHEAMLAHDPRPMEALSDRLMTSDSYLPDKLQRTPNCYINFLKKFPESSFLTFNYDSLVEILLFGLKRWFPADGFGVPVNVVEYARPTGAPAPVSKQLVVHLHGTMYVSTEKVRVVKCPGEDIAMIVPRPQALFHFDPYSIPHCFPSIARDSLHPGTSPWPHDRFIAPIPDKAKGLTQEFIKLAYKRAEDLIAETKLVIAVGYSFNQHDQSSYNPLVRALSHATGPKKVVVVSPDAHDICRRLGNENVRIVWAPVAKTFREWADDGFHIGLEREESNA